MDSYREERCDVGFRPRLEGCVAKDRRFASMLEICYVECFASIAANIYRSLIASHKERALGEAFEWIAQEELEELRLLGELILALGGNAELRHVRLRSHSARACGTTTYVEECRNERMRDIDRYETLMSRTGDRVVRSLMAKLLSVQRRMLDRLNHASVG